MKRENGVSIGVSTRTERHKHARAIKKGVMKRQRKTVKEVARLQEREACETDKMSVQIEWT